MAPAVTMTVLLVDAAYEPVAAYVAVRECEPAVKDVLSVATPLDKVPVPIVVDPSLNVIVPEAAFGVMVAVKTTFALTCGEVVEAARAIVVAEGAAAATVKLTVLVVVATVLLASLTANTTFAALKVAVGVPVTAPVEKLRLRPVGNVPELTK